MTTAYLDDLYRTPGPVLVARLNAGFPASVFPALAARLSLSTKGLARALGISDRTLRNRSGKLTGDEAERSFRAYRVFRRAVEVLGSEPAATAWLGTPQIALGEKKPIEFLQRDVGANEVLDVLSGIEDGGYL